MDQSLQTRKKWILLMLMMHLELLNSFTLLLMVVCIIKLNNHLKTKKRKWDAYSRQLVRSVNFDRIVFISDLACVENTRMDRRSFHVLCNLVRGVGKLEPTKNMGVEEMVAIFLHILAHDVKNRIIKRQFMRSGETISRQFNSVLHAMLRCHKELFKQPEPVNENSTDGRWKWFKNCLGALDGTYVKVNVPEVDKPRYRTRKGEVATNVLGVCTQDMQFVYILAGWEGSAADSRVLRDAISRRNGLKVPQGYYYLCDAGYMNGEGFLAPYRGQRYHLSEWTLGNQPTTPQEFFNMKHSQARNVIERAFGALKGRWAILRGKSFYPVKTQGRIITACALLHNHIWREMNVDPFEVNELHSQGNNDQNEGQWINHLETSDEWSEWRDNLAQEMFNRFRGVGG